MSAVQRRIGTASYLRVAVPAGLDPGRQLELTEVFWRVPGRHRTPDRPAARPQRAWGHWVMAVLTETLAALLIFSGAVVGIDFLV